jgi:hypothetical protein
MFTKRKALLAAGGVPALWLLVMATSAGASAPAKAPSLSCGSVVTTDVRLRHDLVDCPVHGLVVGASGITIDLNGHTIDGGGPFESLSGIFNETYTGVTVRNGQIRDFSRGVEGYQAHGGRYSRLDVSASIEGISLHDSDDSVVDRGRLHHNRTGFVMLLSDRVEITRSAVTSNDTYGATDDDSTGNRYEHNSFSGNVFDGLSTGGSHDAVIERNVFLQNGIDGLNAGGGSDRVVVTRNVAVANDGDGLAVDCATATFSRNTSVANSGVGILAYEDAIDGGRDRAFANGEDDCVNLACR